MSFGFKSKGFGFSTGRGSSGGGGGDYAWQDSDAEAYYDVLFSQNGGDIDSEDIYGVTLNYFKGQIDTCFVTY